MGNDKINKNVPLLHSNNEIAWQYGYKHKGMRYCAHAKYVHTACSEYCVLKAFFGFWSAFYDENMPWNANSSNNSRISQTSHHRHHITYYCIVQSSHSHAAHQHNVEKKFYIFPHAMNKVFHSHCIHLGACSTITVIIARTAKKHIAYARWVDTHISKVTIHIRKIPPVKYLQCMNFVAERLVNFLMNFNFIFLAQPVSSCGKCILILNTLYAHHWTLIGMPVQIYLNLLIIRLFSGRTAKIYDHATQHALQKLLTWKCIINILGPDYIIIYKLCFVKKHSVAIMSL